MTPRTVPLVVPGLLAGLALLLLLPVRPRAPRARRDTKDGTGGARMVLPATVVGAAVLLLHGKGLALTLIVTATFALSWQLVQRRRRDREAEARAVRVLEYCDTLAGDLAVGTPPRTALEQTVADFPDLAPVASAARLGADVPAAMRELSTRHGYADLRLVAGAWQIAERSGGGLAGALRLVADGVRERRRTARLVAAELASAWATARIMAGLPVFFLLAGSGLGSDPWGFLTGSVAGLCCLGAGCALSLTGLFWLQRVASAVLAA